MTQSLTHLNRIHVPRAERHLSRQELADALGVNVQTMFYAGSPFAR